MTFIIPSANVIKIIHDLRLLPHICQLVNLMELKFLILFHVIGSSVWVGGHLVLALSVLPKALKEKNPEIVRVFEERYERIGIPALLIQVITGLDMAFIYLPLREWFSFSDRIHTHISIKLILLMLTFSLALHARFFIIPKLNTQNLSSLGWHIRLITLIALALMFTGVNFRLGIL
jgi:putative copper export protein